jgi:hypothetical protein
MDFGDFEQDLPGYADEPAPQALTNYLYTIQPGDDRFSPVRDSDPLYYPQRDDPSVTARDADPFRMTKYSDDPSVAARDADPSGVAPTGLAALKNVLNKLVRNKAGELDYAKIATLLYGAQTLAKGKETAPKVGFQGVIPTSTATTNLQTAPVGKRQPGAYGINYGGDATYTRMADGGLTNLARGRYLQGATDGMADQIPAQIGQDQPAALSHGEFVIPADVVSHLGNGNSDAGAKKLYQMMDKVRQARTGQKKQGKKINPDNFMPGGLAQAYAHGGSVLDFATGGEVPISGEQTISSYAAPYVTNMLSDAEALSKTPYKAYTGQLTAGPSALQTKTSEGLNKINFPGNLGKSFSALDAPAIPTDGSQPTSSAGGIASQYMNPYLKSVLDPQLAEIRRQAEITNQSGLGGLTKSGAFGGGRQAIMEAEAGRNLMQELNKTVGLGYSNAYDKAMGQFNTEQGQSKDLLKMMSDQGAVDRAMEAEQIAADKAQFEEARANPYKQLQFRQSMLSGLPITATNYSTVTPSQFETLAGNVKNMDELLTRLGLKDAATAPAVPPKT